MKTLVPTLLAFMLTFPVWSAESAKEPLPEGTEAILNAAAHYLDSVFAHAQQSLELIASTPEAQRGDWKVIKPYLQRLAPDLPGVYFFVLPNGNYYSVALDFTNLNLRNRPYFSSLFAGNSVKGFPIYSRSSDQKSALVAVPIVVDNKVVGALGVSIFLDDLVARLEQVMPLPQEYNWFVLNPDATDMLDRDRDYIFMNVLQQGSPSMRDAVTQAMAGESGNIDYELERPRRGYYQKLPDMDWWMFLVKIEGGPIPAPPQLQLSLDRFVPALQDKLNAIDRSLAELIATSHVRVDKEDEIRALLRKLLEENLPIVEAAFIDAKGIIRHIEPPEYINFENMDISTQAHVVAMQKNPLPQLSGGFTAVEQFLAVTIAHPLHDSQKRFVGSISLVIRPELLIEPLLKASTVPEDYELWIMQPDGRIIYDQDREEIGKMLFSAPIYASHESLLELGKTIASTPTGEGSYIFLAPELKKKAIKKAVWQTINLHGREWRVVLAYRPYK